MRISDWSSDVCSSDLLGHGFQQPRLAVALRRMGVGAVDKADPPVSQRQDRLAHFARRIPVVDNEAQAASQLKPRIDPREGQVPAFQYIENPVRVAQGRDEDDAVERRSEEHTSELQSLMRNSYAVFCL